MSLMKDTIIDSEVKDTYKEHKLHNTYQEDCSECYKNVMLFDGKIDDDITNEEWEQCLIEKRENEARDAIDSYNDTIFEI